MWARSHRLDRTLLETDKMNTHFLHQVSDQGVKQLLTFPREGSGPNLVRLALVLGKRPSTLSVLVDHR